jgi:hypothetical protein
MILVLAGAAHGATLRGVVTGEVEHLPWRKGKEELGWCTVELWQEDHRTALTRTNAGTGAFAIEGIATDRGEARLKVSRPGFVEAALELTLGAEPAKTVKIRLERNPHYHRIVSPRLGAAVTTFPGETFAIECLAPPDAEQWRADLRSQVGYVPLQVKAEHGERAVWNGTRPGWRLRARVPEELAPGMYDLGIGYVDGAGERVFTAQAHAVCVRPEPPSRFRLMPYLDFHLDWHVTKPGAAGEVQKDFFQAASLLNPLFVSLGDDVGFESDDAVAMLHHLVSHHCTVPVYLAFGNHDAGIGAEGFEHYFGPRWQTRRIGPHVGLILSYDLYQANYQMPAEQTRFVNDALARFHADPRLKLIFLAGHLHAWKPRKDYFTLPFTPAERPTLVAHTEGGKAVEAQRLFVHALSVSSMHGWAGLNYTARVVEFQGVSDDAPTVKAAVLPQAALPVVTFARPNNGTARSNAATIRLRGLEGQWTPPEKLYTGGYFCDPPKAFQALPGIADARLRFLMAPGRYRCTGGRIVSAQTGADGVCAVTVAVDIRPPETTVRVHPE